MWLSHCKVIHSECLTYKLKKATDASWNHNLITHSKMEVLLGIDELATKFAHTSKAHIIYITNRYIDVGSIGVKK